MSMIQGSVIVREYNESIEAEHNAMHNTVQPPLPRVDPEAAAEAALAPQRGTQRGGSPDRDGSPGHVSPNRSRYISKTASPGRRRQSLREQKVAAWQRSKTEQLSQTNPKLLENRTPAYHKESRYTRTDEEIMLKTTVTPPSTTIANDLKHAGNITKFSFHSGTERTIESVRRFCPHLKEMSRPIFEHIGPGYYSGNDILERESSSKNVVMNRGFGIGRRNLLPSTPRKVESYGSNAVTKGSPKKNTSVNVVDKKVRVPKGRDLNRSMFATAYLKRSYHTPPPPAMTKLL